MRVDKRRARPGSAYGALTVWLFVSFLILYAALTRGHFWSTDEIAMYQQTRSLWEHGNVATENFLNTLPGRNGKYYAPWSGGQAVLSLPLYGLGKGVRQLLEWSGKESWKAWFAGDVQERTPAVRWSGDVEIFFVNLFSAIAVAGLVAVFFAFNLRLGAAPAWALIAALLLGLTSHVAGFSTGYFQHAGEALFLLWTVFLLYSDSVKPHTRTRLAAGGAAAAMILVRVQTVVALPALTAYLLWNLWRDTGQPKAVVMRSCAFLAPVAAAVGTCAAVNYLKFGAFDLGSRYVHLSASQGAFDNSVVAGLYGMLVSPGAGILVFTPLLLFLPWYFRGFARAFRSETAMISGIVLGYVLLYVKNIYHGQWSFGPRFLMPLVPLLLLPLARWLPGLRLWGRLAVGAAAGAGLIIEILHVAVNVSAVYYAEGYLKFVPEFSYLYIPQSSQIAAHWRGLMAWDNRVDFWLVYLARHFGLYPMLWVVLLLAAALWLSAGRVMGHLRAAQVAYAKGAVVVFDSRECRALGVVAMLWLAIAYEAAFQH